METRQRKLRSGDDLGARRVSREGGSGLGDLGRSESLLLVGGHGDLVASETPLGGLEERGSVRVQGLVSGDSSLHRSARLDTSRMGLGSSSLLKGLDDGVLHGELDEVHGEVPDDVPDPDDTDPSTGDRSDVGEAPVSEGGDLGGKKRSKEGSARYVDC
jgi:hypothetical protein